MTKRMIIPCCILAAAILGATASVIVDETEYAVVTRLGRIVAVHGDEPGESGLHWKAPWDQVRRVDRRLRLLDAPAREVITGDKKSLEAAAYLLYRVVDPVRFLRAASDHRQAELRLQERMASAVSDVVGQHELAALASTRPGEFALEAISSAIGQAIARPARDELGIEIVDARLARFSHPLEVRPAVFELIRSERRQVAAALRADGEAQYTRITSEADRARDELLATAEAEAEKRRGQAEAEAARILAQAHTQDPQFFEFLRTLDTYKAILDGKTTLVLSAANPLFRLLAEGPAAPAQTTRPDPRRPVATTTADKP